MALTDETAGIDEVAAALGRQPEWLRRNWLKIHLRDGFPRKLPCGWAWPRAMVTAWLRAGGAPDPAMPSPTNDNDVSSDPVAAFRAELNRRYGGDQ